MKGLLTKDFLVLTKEMKLFLILIPIMILTGGPSIASGAILIGAALPMLAMAYDEQANWDDLAVMMPYSGKDRILSKYVLGYLCMAGAAALFAAVELILLASQHRDLEKSIHMILFSIVGGLLLIAVNMPFSLRYGTQKGRFIYFLFIGTFVALGSMVQKRLLTLPENMISVLPVMAVLAALALNVISILISLHIKHR